MSEIAWPWLVLGNPDRSPLCFAESHYFGQYSAQEFKESVPIWYFWIFTAMPYFGSHSNSRLRCWRWDPVSGFLIKQSSTSTENPQTPKGLMIVVWRLSSAATGIWLWILTRSIFEVMVVNLNVVVRPWMYEEEYKSGGVFTVRRLQAPVGRQQLLSFYGTCARDCLDNFQVYHPLEFLLRHS